MATVEKQARSKVEYAIRRGRLTRPGGCSECGGDPVQAHHPDYSRPLDVEWLCPRCHGKRARRWLDEFCGWTCPRCGDLTDNEKCGGCGAFVVLAVG